MKRYVCIHGHFYQPPRENPWLEEIELQDSAYPFHDWNARITAECYGPNGVSRILDAEDRIARIVNNYARISFNFGPTLLSWMERHAPEVYRGVLDADVESRARFGGHGSAIAQAYNHMIMPLASERDRRTQVVWGLRDFEARFGRKAEGMWLPEAAVDAATLEVLAEHGVAFTVLAPRQARAVRALGEAAWVDVSGGRVDPSRPYRVELPSGRSIAVFFYDGPISQGVAFEGLLHRGEYLAHRLLGAFSPTRTWPQLVHIATDGETYGHHHRRGEMALAYALEYIERNELATLTNYGEHLERFPPTHEARVYDDSSWSCAHGVERWRSDCGCSTGGRPGWNQSWRGPLRSALDWLRDELATRFEERAAHFLGSPWAARDAYIDVVLSPSDASRAEFLRAHAKRELTAHEGRLCLRLLEMQRHAMLMFTSCGWFFDELSGIEPVQVLQYAARAVQLCRAVTGDDLEPGLLERLERARSNVPEHGDGRRIYERMVRPASVDLAKVAAHYAMTSLFDEYPTHARVYAYDIERLEQSVMTSGSMRVLAGTLRARARVTGERAEMIYAALHVGDHNLHAGVRELSTGPDLARLTGDLAGPIEAADLPAVVRVLDRHFGELPYSIRSLFRDEQRTILDRLLGPTLARTEATYQQLYERNSGLTRFLTSLGVPLPRALLSAAEFALNSQLKAALGGDEVDGERVRRLVAEAKAGAIPLDHATLAFALRGSVARLTAGLVEAPLEVERLRRLEAAASASRAAPFGVDLSGAQDAFWRLLKGVRPVEAARAASGDARAAAWVEAFDRLGEALRMRGP